MQLLTADNELVIIQVNHMPDVITKPHASTREAVHNGHGVRKKMVTVWLS